MGDLIAAFRRMAEDEDKGPAVVKLISSEGDVFLIERDAAMVSGTIKNMLSSPGMFVESSGEITFPEIPAVVLEKVCQYFHYKLKFTNSTQPQAACFCASMCCCLTMHRATDPGVRNRTRGKCCAFCRRVVDVPAVTGRTRA